MQSCNPHAFQGWIDDLLDCQQDIAADEIEADQGEEIQDIQSYENSGNDGWGCFKSTKNSGRGGLTFWIHHFLTKSGV